MDIRSSPRSAMAAVPTDKPQKSRGFLLDSARCQENRAYYQAFIDFTADRGVNLLLWHFTDDQGCSLQLDCVPEAGSPHAYSKTEMRELIRYASDRGVEIVPELASLGHSRYLTRLPAYRHLNEADAHFTGMCPVSEETRRVIRALIEETADVFESKNFHVGLDEVNIGGHPLTRAALQTRTRGDLLADYATFVHGVVTRTGRRMWMWGDGLLKHTEMLDRVPRDVVICNWQYTPDASPATTQKLLDAGFDVMLCSAMISHDQPLFPGDQFAVPNVRTLQSQQLSEETQMIKGREGARPEASEQAHGSILGHINTIWTPVRFVADSLWVGVDLAAAVLRASADADAPTQAKHFGETFHGLRDENASSFAEAARTVFELSPLRNEWLAVVKLETLSQAMHQRVRIAAGKWSRTFVSLRKIAPAVREHSTEYAAFLLLIEMLAHAYDAASHMSEISPSAASISRMMRRGSSMLERIDRNWDRERFADDPRKYEAPIASFQDDHLIPLLQTGLVVMKERYDLALVQTPGNATKSLSASAVM